MSNELAGMLGAVGLVAVVFAWDFGRRWLAYRGRYLVQHARLDRFEADLADHKKTHGKALDNLVTEMRESCGRANTQSSVALERANKAVSRRFGT